MPKIRPATVAGAMQMLSTAERTAYQPELAAFVGQANRDDRIGIELSHGRFSGFWMVSKRGSKILRSIFAPTLENVGEFLIVERKTRFWLFVRIQESKRGGYRLYIPPFILDS
jgi:hypothetical protein